MWKLTLHPSWATLFISLAMIILMYRRFGIRDPLVTIFGFYVFFAYGPVLNFLLGHTIYFGIIHQHIFDATIIFTIALATVFVISNLITPKLSIKNVTITSSTRLITILSLVFLGFIGLTAYMLFSAISYEVWKLGKSQRITVGSSFHYQYLLFQMFTLSFYFHIEKFKHVRYLYFLNFILYILYCMIFAERDFIFLITSLVQHKYLLSHSKPNWKRNLAYILLIPSLIILAILIVRIRSDSSGNNLLTDILNEGSILFVTTTILEWTSKASVGFTHGQTYLNSFINLIPNIFLPQQGKMFFLSRWFARVYAPNGSSTYGFSLGAEAYLNFGFWGIPIIFAFITLIQRWSFNRIGTHPFYLFFSVFFVSFSMYSLRNDSLALVSGIFHAGLFFSLIYFISILVISTHKQQRPPQPSSI